MSTTTSRHAARREPRFSFLPRRKGQARAPQAPVAAIPFEGASEVGLMPPAPLPAPAGDETLLFRIPGLDGGPGFAVPSGPPWDQPGLAGLTLAGRPPGVLRPETAPGHAEPGPDLAAAPQDRPYVPQDSGLPSSWLRAVPQSGPGGRILETLTGLPFYAGTRGDTRAEGICLGAADDIFLILDTQSAGVLDALEAAVRQARDNRVYGGFRAPAVQADPDAAEHRRVLLEELDACEAAGPEPGAGEAAGDAIAFARGVHERAGNLVFTAGIISGNGEAVMDAFAARAGLAGAVARYDQLAAEAEQRPGSRHEGLSGIAAAAADDARQLVAIVRELCGDSAADAMAGVPAVPAEAVTAAGEGEAA